MIRLDNISKSFYTETVETKALQGVSLEINQGEFVAVMGPSGCGKTTLLQILGMLDYPTEGQYFLEDKEVGALKENQRTRLRRGNIGFVFQNFNLLDDLTVYENVELPLRYLKMGAKERKQLVEEVLDKLNMTARAKHYPQQLSGGQQQRVAVARAVVAKPKLILADEPTGNLDSANGTEVMRLLTDVNRDGATIVMVTHSQHAAAFAHRIIHLFDGKIVEE